MFDDIYRFQQGSNTTQLLFLYWLSDEVVVLIIYTNINKSKHNYKLLKKYILLYQS